jgi:hypothetical protein
MQQTMLDRHVVKNAVLLACRAPSVHNSQPWRWVYQDATLHLFVDPRRRVRKADRFRREAILSCGVILDHLRVAMVAGGWQAQITRLPNQDNPDHLAAISFEPLDFVTDAERLRATAILQRRTDRLPLCCPPNWPSFEPVLRDSIDESVAVLDVLSDEVRPQLARVSRLTEFLRREDVTYQAELQWWTASFVADAGVLPETLGSAAELQRVAVAREFPHRGSSDRRAEVMMDRSKILVLSTESDSRADLLGCGEALSTVLLECTMAGMATCTLTHLVELADSRDIVRTFTDKRREPQVLVRTGIAPYIEALPSTTPRRPLHEILQFKEAR